MRLKSRKWIYLFIPIGLLIKLIILGILLNLPEGCKKEENINFEKRNESSFLFIPAGKVDLSILFYRNSGIRS